MSIKTLVEYWNKAPNPEEVHVIVHSRKKFYGGIDISWYEFSMDGMSLHELSHESMIPGKFLSVADTDYYEFGGNSEEALKSLTEFGFRLIVDGNEL